jgi:type 1 glutamine amidotransferase
MKKNQPVVFKLLVISCLFLTFTSNTGAQKLPFRVLVVASPDPDHGAMIISSQAMLEKIGSENGFTVDFTRDASLITDENLLNYKVVVQLHLAYFEMTQKEQSALQHFISQGKGWVGIHAAGLTGKQFINKETTYWDWYQKMIGDVTYSDHPALQTGTIKVEDRDHPVMKNLPESFSFYDEWYEFDKSPRSNVHVLATADETSYKPKKPMGDHPMIWTNPTYNRAIYIGIGHDVTACSDPNFAILMKNAILWAASPVKNSEQSTSTKNKDHPDLTPEFKALVLTERGGQHEDFVVAALDWLNTYSKEMKFEITVINHASEIDEALLSKYQVFIELNYPPYNWGEKAMAAFVKYIEEGRGGWVGFHHAALLGEFDGYPMWSWFSDFMGGIRFKNYIAATASGRVNIEDKNHPVMKGVSPSFVIPDDEWYTFDKNPRPNVHVLASVDESSYKPASDIKMGDHPVIWVNDKMKARNVYFLMGHSPSLLSSAEFKEMFGNAIIWAAGK